mmetsp:Transcript_114074/g.333421  ORF Transcript_114074/g.333421 Transcript_114074/m.333421 type:complete len:426 (-) Transcript_114074:203-1480(-)
MKEACEDRPSCEEQHAGSLPAEGASQEGDAGGITLQMFVAAGCLRAVIIAVSVFQDLYAEVPYTDVDYRVFSEAAENVALGLSPFDGRTALLKNEETKYRYSPLLAYLLIPNIYVHPSWGKVLFAAMDLVAARHLLRWLRAHSSSAECVRWGLAVWLFNPFIFTISTRGSCESLAVAILYGMLDALCVCNRPRLAALLFGLAVHLRMYPIIYALPLLFLVGARAGYHDWRCLLSREAWYFALVSGAAFLALLALFTGLYGADFVKAAYLHHTSRADTRHNFSVYFYPLRWFPALAQLSTIPQLAACAVVGWTRGRAPLARAMLLQTLCFVALNRVVTAQYFVWWLSLLPPAFPWLIRDWRLVSALLLWAAGEVHWLCWAYFLEFREWPIAWLVWLASCAFLLAEVNLLVLLRRPCPGPAHAARLR